MCEDLEFYSKILKADNDRFVVELEECCKIKNNLEKENKSLLSELTDIKRKIEHNEIDKLVDKITKAVP